MVLHVLYTRIGMFNTFPVVYLNVLLLHTDWLLWDVYMHDFLTLSTEEMCEILFMN